MPLLMNKLYSFLLVFCCFTGLYAKSQIPAGRIYFHSRIDDYQKAILNLTAVPDDIKATATTKIDNLQNEIEADNQLDDTNKQKFLRGLQEALGFFINGYKSGTYSLSLLPELVNAYKEAIHPELNHESIASVITTYDSYVAQMLIDTYAFKANTGIDEIKDIILGKQMRQHPEPKSVMPILLKHPNLPGIDTILSAVARIDPNIIYDYSQNYGQLADRILNSNDKLVNTIGHLGRMKTGRQIFPFLDEIVEGKMTVDQISSAVDNNTQYFNLLVQTEIDYADKVRLGSTPLAKKDMETRIAAKAREDYINEINALHERPDAERFRVIDNLSPQALYYLAISSEEEIYTSSYVRGVYPRIFKSKKLRADSLLMSVRFDHFKKWIKMAANYNDLDDFLSRMDKESAQVLMKAFVKGLDKTNSLEDAVDVANSYSSITDKDVRSLVLNEVQYNLQKAKDASNTRGTNIYNILNILFLSMDSTNRIDVPRLLGIPPVFYMPNKNLQDSAGTIIVQQFFYGDDDGRAGFDQFTSMFGGAGWSVKSNAQWVVHTSTGKGTKVVIYSNRPLDEKKGLDADAQKALGSYLDENGISPTIVIHRGHSYYLSQTLDQLASSAEIVVLGSCGAYQSLNKVLTKCTTAHIVSSKQTGSQRVNGPLIKEMMETLRQGKTLNWQVLWKQLDREVSDKELFSDYVPPYKNLGALFIMAYNRLPR